MLDLLQIVTHFRTIMENDDIRQMYLPLNHFPLGACQDASIMLGAFLNELGFGTFYCALGENLDQKTHSWLENDEYLIDITADQFVGNPKIIFQKINENYNDHIGFYQISKQIAEISALNEILFSDTIRSYNVIKSRLNNISDLN